MNRHRGHQAEQDENGATGVTGGCAEFGPLLEAYHHHALDPKQAHSVAKHAAECAACGTALERFAATDQLIAASPTALPGPELRQRLAARIAEARSGRAAKTAAPVPIERITVVNDANDANDANDVNDSPWTRTETPMARTGKGVQRMRVWLGTVAAVLVVALLAGVFATKMHEAADQGGTGRSFSPATGVCAPGKISAQLPPNTSLSDLTMVSPNEGWAVGSVSSTVSSSGGGAVHPTPSLQNPESALILHFRNCTWTPVATNYPGARLLSISMDSPNDGWAVGDALGKPLALHYANGAWTSVTLTEQSALQGSFGAVRMLSSGEGWIVVESNNSQQGNISSGLLHLANGHWSTVNVPLKLVADVLPVGQSEAWVAGDTSVSPLIPALYHYQAGEWTAVTLPSGVFIDRLRMDTPVDIWASAHAVVPLNSEGDQSAAVALHYDGTNWAQVNLGTGGKAQLVQSFGASAAWAFSLQRTDAGETISRMQYGGGSAWQTVKLPATDLLDVSSLVRVAPDEYWAIGHYVVRAKGNVAPRLLYFANGTWHEYRQ